MQSSFKVIIIVLAVGAMSAGAYFALGNKANGQADEPLLQSEVSNKAVGVPDGNTTTDQTVQVVLRQINDLDQIKLNTDIFDKPEFLALNDISQDLPEPRDIGRPNPFAPIGVDVGVVQSDEAPAGQAGFPNANLAISTNDVKTNQVSNIGQRSATLNADVFVTTSTDRWFEWGTNQNTVNRTAKQTGTETTFTATLTNLGPNVIYYVKAAVEENGVVSYGDVVTFRTAQ